jgi:hypothetical protein
VAHLFGPPDTARFRFALLVLPSAIAGIAVISGVVYRSPYYTRVGVHLDQPVPFSHQHHVSGLGIDCRYCHARVETSAFAGMPSTKTCMRCHSQIWSDSPMLAPVRASYQNGTPLHWTRVYDLPDYVYFNHAIHVTKGVACSTCHGRVDQMPLMAKAEPLHMRWCVECHRDPQLHMGPKDEVFAFGDQKRGQDHARLARLDLPRSELDDCGICHR